MTIETVIIIVALMIFMLVREVLHYNQVVKLQELLKSSDLSEYYQVHRKVPAVESSTNTVMEEPNAISSAEGDFDIRKVSSVIVDGQEKPINIY